RILHDWERKIKNAYSRVSPARKAQSKADSDAALARLKELRSRIFDRGIGEADEGAVARVIDTGLRDSLVSRDSIPLNFDKGGWFPARFQGNDLSVLLEGEVNTIAGRETLPLLVKFP